MRYELGDYVRFDTRWKKQEYPYVFEGEDDFYSYCKKHGIDEGLPISIMEKIHHIDQGYICGIRKGIKIFHILDYEKTDVGIGVISGFYTHSEKYEDMYLVVTRMNCIYRVSKEDIKLLKDNADY